MFKKYLPLLLLFASCCFSQNKEYSISQIDSIAEANGRYSISEGKVDVTENGKLIGNGGFTVQTFLDYHNNAYYNSLGSTEKRQYNREKDSELVKGTYSYNVQYNDGRFLRVYSEFYYRSKLLIFARLKVNQRDKEEKEQMEDFEVSADEINEGKAIKNVLLFDVQSWIRDKNAAILKLYK